jgi:addiction module HigA family antidote
MAKTKLQTPAAAITEKIAEYQLSIGQVAADLKISRSLFQQVLSGKTRLSLGLAHRLAKYFATTPEYWHGLQTACDFAEIKKDAELAKDLKDIPKAKKPSAKEIAAAKEKQDAKAAKAAKGKKSAKAPAKAKKEAKAASPRGRKAAVKDTPVRARKAKAAADEKKAASPKARVARKPKALPAAKEKEAPKKPNTILIKKNDIPPSNDDSSDNNSPTLF